MNDNGRTWGGGVRSRAAALFAVAGVLAAGVLSPVRASYNRNENSGNTLDTAISGADPVNMATGEFHFLRPLVDLGGPIPLGFSLTYGSTGLPSKPAPDGLSPQFRHNMRLVFDTGLSVMHLALGENVLLFEEAAGEWTPLYADPHGHRMLTGAGGTNFYFMDAKRSLVHILRTDPSGGDAHLVRTLDRNGNALVCEYGTNMAVRGPDAVRDGLGRELRLGYTNESGTNLLTSVQDHSGRTWTLVYEWTPPDNTNRLTLRSVVRPDGSSNRFEYAGSGFLAREIEPAGTWAFTNVYSGGAVVRQADPLGNTSTVSYLTGPGAGDVRTALLNPDGTRRTFVHQNEKRAVKTIVDEERREARFGTVKPYTVARDQFTNVTDRLGRRLLFGHDEASGRLSSRTDPAGRTIQYRYASTTQAFVNADNGEAFQFVFRDLVAVEYPDGTRDGFARDGKGNLVAFTNQLGAITRYGYNSRGQVAAVTNAAGGVVSFGYDTNGNLVTHSDADSGTWSNTVDVLGRVTRVTAPDGTFRQYAYDILDRLTNAVDEAGIATAYRYDLNGNPTQTVQAAGTALARTNAYAYDALNRLVRRTDAAGFATTLGYTWWGAVSNVTLPDGACTVFRHTPSRHPLSVVDPLGNESRVAVDAEGVPTGVTLPDGRTVSSVLDALGRTVATVDPLSNVTAVARDDYERVTNVVDRLGRETRLARDAEGRITAIDVPGVGTARYAYNAIGSVTNVTDPRSNAWSFGFSALGRMASIRDPLGRTESFAYDAAGRLAGATFMDGSTVTNRRDARGAVTNRLYSDGTSLAFTYDALGRFAGSGGAAPVTVAYDARGLVTNTTFNGGAVGATHDAVGRIATLAYGGGMTVTYAYDLRGLVTQVVDSVSGAKIAFAYNANGEVTRVERSNGVATDPARDAAGRVTEIRHGAHGTLGMSYDAEDRITRIDRALPLATESNLVDAVETFTHDAANNLTTAGFVQDARGRRLAEPGAAYRWDAADRLVSISNAAGVVSNVYTASGELARRIKGAVTTDFVHTWSLPLRPLLVEKRNGVVQRYYVHSPGGTLLYHVEAAAGNAVRFHHHDHLGTTLFLTDGAGAVSDAYAYTAYGRILRHTGTSEQPFTFLGARGVRAEDGTTLLHMRARWYDARTARFISFDPLWTALLSDPLQINPYQYVRGSPAMLTDETGECPPLPTNNLWKYVKNEWEQLTTVMSDENWARLRVAMDHWLRNRHAGPGEYDFLLPSTDAPRILGETSSKPQVKGRKAEPVSLRELDEREDRNPNRRRRMGNTGVELILAGMAITDQAEWIPIFEDVLKAMDDVEELLMLRDYISAMVEKTSSRGVFTNYASEAVEATEANAAAYRKALEMTDRAYGAKIFELMGLK